MGRKSDPRAKHRWDAGDLGCVKLIIGLQRALAGLAARETVEVTAHDAGALVDIPAWCGMTGHELLLEDHPIYIIRKKGD